MLLQAFWWGVPFLQTAPKPKRSQSLRPEKARWLVTRSFGSSPRPFLRISSVGSSPSTLRLEGCFWLVRRRCLNLFWNCSSLQSVFRTLHPLALWSSHEKSQSKSDKMSCHACEPHCKSLVSYQASSGCTPTANDLVCDNMHKHASPLHNVVASIHWLWKPDIRLKDCKTKKRSGHLWWQRPC